jgi:heat shock protein HslJ
MACAEESLTVQEQQYIAALQSAGQFELTADQLVIHYDNGQGVLNFVADDTVSNAPTPAGDENSLVGSQWQLESFGPTAAEMPVIASSTVTLEFDTAEQATGSGGCNTYGGNYTVQGDSISFGKIISTERACVEEGVTEQEQQYFAALQTAESFSQTAERLTILYDGGQNALNFVPTTAADDSSSSGEGFPPNNDVLLTIVTEDGMPIKWYQNGPPAS